MQALERACLYCECVGVQALERAYFFILVTAVVSSNIAQVKQNHTEEAQVSVFIPV